MAILQSLQQMRPLWMEKISRELASGEGVRVGFLEQLERFYDLLEQTVATGNSAWLDPILYDWGHSPTETNLEEGDYFVSFVMTRIIAQMVEVTRRNLNAEDALELIAGIMPIFVHSLSVIVRYEMEARVTHISDELGKTQEKLQELDHKKSNFISVTAHELKTPLTLIEGYATMMADMMEASGQNQMDGFLKGMQTGIGRMRRIIDDMLDVSLIDNNLLKLNIQPLWVSHLLTLLQNDLKNIIAQRKQNLTVNEFEGHDLMIYGDAERLYQALYNVAINAVKFTPDGGIITVDGRVLPGFVEITVTDTGIGISSKDQATIFEKFGQLGRTNLHSSGKTKFKGGGPGLGLSIAKGIIEAHGGTIWVESEGYDEVKLHGSTFHLIVPTHAEPSDPRVAKLFGDAEKK
jgi:signal transduction histidine kinase